MFCKNCGKIIAENALFCTHCGTATDQNPAVSEPMAEQVTTLYEQVTAPTEATEVPSPITEPSIPVQEPVQSAAFSQTIPEMQSIPVSGVAPQVSQPVETPQTVVAPAEKEQKYYTLGHLIMCLAAVGIMAIIAGVFAGLYFSVV